MENHKSITNEEIWKWSHCPRLGTVKQWFANRHANSKKKEAAGSGKRQKQEKDEVDKVKKPDARARLVELLGVEAAWSRIGASDLVAFKKVGVGDLRAALRAVLQQSATDTGARASCYHCCSAARLTPKGMGGCPGRGHRRGRDGALLVL